MKKWSFVCICMSVFLCAYRYYIIIIYIWLYNWAIIYMTEINICVQVSLLYADFDSFCYSLGSSILDHMADLFLVFWGTFMMVSTVAGVIYILSNSGISVTLSTHPQQHLLFVSWWFTPCLGWMPSQCSFGFSLIL
jgi:hypothetical protein